MQAIGNWLQKINFDALESHLSSVASETLTSVVISQNPVICFVICYPEFTTLLYIVIICRPILRALSRSNTRTRACVVTVCVCVRVCGGGSKRVLNVTVKRTSKPTKSATIRRNEKHHIILTYSATTNDFCTTNGCVLNRCECYTATYTANIYHTTTCLNT